MNFSNSELFVFGYNDGINLPHSQNEGLLSCYKPYIVGFKIGILFFTRKYEIEQCDDNRYDCESFL